MNNRRKLLVALGAGALATPYFAFAQQPGKVWRVGFLTVRARTQSTTIIPYDAFKLGMRELGYVEGKNLIIEWRSADTKNERLPSLVSELINLKVDVIVAWAPPAANAALKATSTIPIVMVAVADPVGAGFVKSLAKPGGNVTGLSNMAGELGPKNLEMLLGMSPKLSHVGVLMNPENMSNIK